MQHKKYNKRIEIMAEIFGTALKHGLTQFVLALALFCNPMAALAVMVADTFDAQSSAMGDMPCQMEMQSTQFANQDTEDEQADPLDCCDRCACSMDLSCQSCVNLYFVNAMLLETPEFCISNTLQGYSELDTGHLPDRPILPEIHPRLHSITLT